MYSIDQAGLEQAHEREAGHSAAPATKIGFLFNHEAPHQIAHSAPIARELAAGYPQFTIDILATSAALLDHARNLTSDTEAIHYVLLDESGWQGLLAPGFDAFMPFSRILNLFRHRERLASYDVLVVPERTSLFLKKVLKDRTPKLIYTRHGSGDRSIGVTPAAGRFDLVLLSGRKIRDRFLELGYLKPDQFAVVGYSKFDTISKVAPKRLFANDRPTVLYNPHPDPKLSSFYDMGLDVLEFFYNSSDYNLVFAPHVMLFKRKLHISIETFSARIRKNIPERYFNCPHILIDTGSRALLDMTYTRAADIYMGDVSSQIYEFILNPRPCVLLNAHDAQWRDDPNYLFWTFGPVASHISDLDRALHEARQEHYFETQQAIFRETFDITDKPASLRAAEAIVAHLGREE